MRTAALVDHGPVDGHLAHALNRAADILASAACGAEIDAVSLSGRLNTEAGCGLALLRLAEDVAVARHLRQRVQLHRDAFVVTLWSRSRAQS